MAKRYRYAFAKKREAQQGKLSAVLAAVSLVLFVTAVLLAFFLQGQYGFIFCSFQKNTEEQQWKKDSTDII